MSSCGSAKVVGLWSVGKVEIGQEDMTPQSRWIRFNKDGTQQSGNGWYQHSFGTWNLNGKTKRLNIKNSNGYIDNNEDFLVEVFNIGMTWTRYEEGNVVKVSLVKIKEIPQAGADKLLGIWGLLKITDNNKDVTVAYNPTTNNYLFIRWDKQFSIFNTPSGRANGIFRTHGHRQEIEFIYYGNEMRIERWRFEFDQDKLILHSLEKERNIVREYRRIDYFPE